MNWRESCVDPFTVYSRVEYDNLLQTSISGYSMVFIELAGNLSRPFHFEYARKTEIHCENVDSGSFGGRYASTTLNCTSIAQ